MRRKYVCEVCGFVYDPKRGVPENDVKPGTSFRRLPENWTCPECSAGKKKFSVAK